MKKKEIGFSVGLMAIQVS